jgi:hypothetical protein
MAWESAPAIHSVQRLIRSSLYWFFILGRSRCSQSRLGFCCQLKPSYPAPRASSPATAFFHADFLLARRTGQYRLRFLLRRCFFFLAGQILVTVSFRLPVVGLLFVLASVLPRAGPRGRSLLSSVWTPLPGPSVRSYVFSGRAAKTQSRAHRRRCRFSLCILVFVFHHRRRISLAPSSPGFLPCCSCWWFGRWVTIQKLVFPFNIWWGICSACVPVMFFSHWFKDSSFSRSNYALFVISLSHIWGVRWDMWETVHLILMIDVSLVTFRASSFIFCCDFCL